MKAGGIPKLLETSSPAPPPDSVRTVQSMADCLPLKMTCPAFSTRLRTAASASALRQATHLLRPLAGRLPHHRVREASQLEFHWTQRGYQLVIRAAAS